MRTGKNKSSLFAFTFALTAFLIFYISSFTAADTVGELGQLKHQLQEQENFNRQQQSVIQDLQNANQSQQQTIQQLMQKINQLEVRMDGAAAPAVAGAPPRRVNLGEEEIQPFEAKGEEGNTLGRPWFKNWTLSGYGAGGFVSTGGDAAKQYGGFVNYQAAVNFDAEVWEDVHYYQEFETVWVGLENFVAGWTIEMYGHFKDVMDTLFGIPGKNIGMKIGRMDIPYGEDYLTQDVVDNPLVTLSAAWPWGADEGVLLYSHQDLTPGKLNWIFSVMDGTDDRAFEENDSKSYSLKLYGNVTENLYLSGSMFYNGETSESAMQYGLTDLRPYGSRSLYNVSGSSGSGTVDAYSAEVDAKYSFGYDRYIKLQYGFLRLDDDNSFYDRDIHYFQVEPKWNLGPRFDNKLYVVSRVSVIGTFADDEGYTFDGAIYANGSSAFGYETKALLRYAIGIGYWPNPRTLIKLEYSKDDFRLTDASTKDGGTGGRDLVGIIAAMKF